MGGNLSGCHDCIERSGSFHWPTGAYFRHVATRFICFHHGRIDQFKLPIEAAKTPFTAGNGPTLQYKEEGNTLSVYSSKVNFVFDKSTGTVTSYKVDGTEYFKDGFGIQPNFWRGPTDNDYGNGAPKRLQIWKQSSKNFVIGQTNIKEDGKNILLTISYNLPAGNFYLVRYKIYPSGIVHASAKFTPTGAEATRIDQFLW